MREDYKIIFKRLTTSTAGSSKLKESVYLADFVKLHFPIVISNSPPIVFLSIGEEGRD